MRALERSGKTIEEAVDKAVSELGVEREQVEIEVLEEPNKGFLGIIGTRLARVKVTVKINATDKGKTFLREVFTAMGLDVLIEVQKKPEYLLFNLLGSDLGILIGRRGDTLDALQYLVNLVVNRNESQRIRVVVDVEGYRGRREETLQKLALRLADKVKRRGESVVLEPMNPHERRVIHTALQNHKYVYTSSQGEEPFRKVVIVPKK
ncbi:MAG: protein jag [Clostridia bacterium]|nr:protein jag [Clostridia bacterium]